MQNKCDKKSQKTFFLSFMSVEKNSFDDFFLLKNEHCYKFGMTFIIFCFKTLRKIEKSNMHLYGPTILTVSYILTQQPHNT